MIAKTAITKMAASEPQLRPGCPFQESVPSGEVSPPWGTSLVLRSQGKRTCGLAWSLLLHLVLGGGAGV